MDINESVTTYIYENNPISFDNGEEVMINATEMAKPFGKKVAKWLELSSTKEYLDALSSVRKSDTCEFTPVITRNCSPNNGGGTWMHRDVAIEFARWLSLKFYVWLNDKIIELVSTEKTVIKSIPEMDIEIPVYLDDDTML